MLFSVGLTFSFLSSLHVTVVPGVHAASHSIQLTGTYLYGWNGTNPGPTIVVPKGDSVSMNLVSGDNVPHTFVIDVAKAGVTPSPNCTIDKCSMQFPPTQSYIFTVDFGPGTYTYYCSIHLNAMVGTFVVPGPDYGVSSSPSSLTIPQGAKQNSTALVTSRNGFSGPVTLASSGSSPAGISASGFNLNPVNVPAGGTAKWNFTINVPPTASSGQYIIIVTASNSTTFRQTTVSITVPDFTITSSPTSLTVNSGSSGSSTLTITGFNGFSGTVSLAATVPAGRGMTTLGPPNVTLSSTATSATSMLTISSALGIFNVTVTATSGSTSHSIDVLVNGPDFTIKASPASLSLNQGASGTLIVTLSGINGFSGSVSLSANPSSGGLTASLSSNTLQVPASGTVTSTLTVTAPSSGAYSTGVSQGSYTITLNATMGSLSHLASIPLTVTSPSFGAGLLTNPVFIGGIIGVVAIVGVAIYVLSRRGKKSNL